MRSIGKFVKAPDERKRYSIDYSEWLDVGETLSGVTFEVTPADGAPVIIDDIAINPTAKGVEFYVSAGDDDVTYTAIATATTSGGQIKEDGVFFVVRAPASA